MVHPATSLDALAAAVAVRLGLRGNRPGSLLTERASPMDTRGVYRKGRGFFVDAQIQGHKVRRGGFRNRAQAAEWIALLRTEPEELEAYLASRIKHRQRTAITDLAPPCQTSATRPVLLAR